VGLVVDRRFSIATIRTMARWKPADEIDHPLDHRWVRRIAHCHMVIEHDDLGLVAELDGLVEASFPDGPHVGVAKRHLAGGPVGLHAVEQAVDLDNKAVTTVLSTRRPTSGHIWWRRDCVTSGSRPLVQPQRRV
jgi:hypothetical protein